MKKDESKLKIVWLCHFVNSFFIDKYGNSIHHREIAPWINNLINLFEFKPDIELHIVAPNYFNSRDIFISHNGISYHIYGFRKLFPKKIWRISYFHEITNYIWIKYKVKKVITKINPDIVHLHGAENPYYATTVLKLLSSFNVIVTIQGFVNQDKRLKKNLYNYKRIKIENKILRKCKYFGVRTIEMSNYIYSINSNAKLYWHNYPLTKPNIEFDGNSIEKTYDLVFFGRVSPENGIKDLLKAIIIIKKNRPKVKLNVVGPFNNTAYKKELFNYCDSNNLQDNVDFQGYLATQQLAYKEIIKAKIDVLPTYYDIIPGTILECMYLGTPVIAYSVGGIPELNSERESVVLVNRGDVCDLATKIGYLLDSDSYRSQLSLNAKETVRKYYDNNKIYSDLLNMYRSLNDK